MRLSELLARLASKVVDHVFRLILVALTPGALGVVGGVIARANGISYLYIIIAVVGAYSVSATGVAMWFYDHRAKRAARTASMIRAVFVSDVAVSGWHLTGADQRAGAQLAEKLIVALLNDLRVLLAYRVDPVRKGVALLLLEDAEVETSSFVLFAQVGHDSEDRVAHEIHALNRNRGLAGQAIRENRCILLRDCENPPKGIDWVRTQRPPEREPAFRGRAATPINVYQSGSYRSVGSLCFDIAPPWLLNEEDQDILNAYADKIARLLTVLVA